MKIAEGAEAVILLERGKVLKIRQRKGYRIKALDERIRSFRTKREVKIMERLNVAGVKVPKVINVSDKTIKMNYIKGEKVRDAMKTGNCVRYGKMMGEAIAVMHDNDVIHGDLTTSNMIMNKELWFIDFGLSFVSERIEDRAVDIHLLKQALNSYHSDISEKCFTAFLRGYSKYSKSKEVLKRLEKVESRGKYKGKK